MQLNIMNFRDVSGYKNRYGEVMKPGKIFRGASLERLTKEEVAYMEDELNIRYILDYRDEKEASMKPDVEFPKAEYIRIGAMKGDSAEANGSKGLDFGELLQGAMNKETLLALREYLFNGYRRMPFDNPAYKLLFDRLLRDDGSVYFHCSAGKDRTGLSAMLIMMALGMSQEDIIHEYMLSNEYLKETNKRFYVEHSIPEAAAPLVDPLLGVAENNIRVSFEAIRKKYSSFEEYLENEYHVGEEERKTLRKIYCEKTNI